MCGGFPSPQKRPSIQNGTSPYCRVRALFLRHPAVAIDASNAAGMYSPEYRLQRHARQAIELAARRAVDDARQARLRGDLRIDRQQPFVDIALLCEMAQRQRILA